MIYEFHNIFKGYANEHSKEASLRPGVLPEWLH
jgi:hypothetical protein